MRLLMKLSAFTVSTGMSGVALAQSTFGYNVNWGVQSVPISPWVSAVIGLLLVLATYAFIRRHAGQGLFMLIAATLVGGLALHTDDSANAGPVTLKSITTSSGSEFYSCSPLPAYDGYQNGTGKNLRLTLSPVGIPTNPSTLGATSSPANITLCHVGDQELAPGGVCYMPCSSA